MPRLFHHLDHAVERDAVSAVGEGRIEVGVERAGRSVGVAFPRLRTLDDKLNRFPTP